jgi:parallel beta-helix repeat protein
MPISLVEKVSGSTAYVGTGPGNATASIQDAIDNHAIPGDTVFVYAGTYSENIIVDKTINLTGEDRNSTIIMGDGGGNVVFINTAWANITDFTIINGTFGCMISGSLSSNNNTIAGNNILNNTYGIYLNTASNNNMITGNNISNNNDGIQLNSASNNNITGNNVSWNIDDGIAIGSSSNNIITSNYVSWNNDDGIHIGSSSINNTIAHNIVFNNTYGIFLDYTSNNNITGNNVSNNTYGIYMWSSSNNTIAGNNISSNSLWGIYMEGSSNDNTVTGNNVSNNDDGFKVGSSSNNTIIGNYVSWNNDDGILVSSSSNNTIEGNNVLNNTYGINLYSASNNNITGNNISSNSRCGFSISGSSNNTIACNNIFASGKDGFYMWSSSDNIISGNNISSNNWSGISLEGASTNIIEYNNILSNNYHGIYLWQSSNITITGNNITNNSNGIFLSELSNNTITYNNISFNSDNGIYLNTASYNNTITGNNITNNLDGIDLESASNNNRIIGNNISSNIDCGIELDSVSNNIIKGNNITNNTNGLYLIGVSNNTIAGNNIYLNDNDGIFLHTASNNNTIIGNNISSNTWSGIYLSGSYNNTITGNNVLNNADGIYLMQSSNNTMVCNNISDNYNGIYLQQSINNTIEYNNITINYNGIYLNIASNNNTITGNNITNNMDGIDLESASNNNRIIGNDISSSIDSGIELESVSNNIIKGNYVSSNTGNGIYLTSSTNNSIYHNNIISNTNSAFDDSNNGNQWDNGYPSGGNYWSDYAGVDIFSGPSQDIPGSDWIGDTNYTIDADSIDHYPLMLPTYLIPPRINNCTADPDLQETGGWINISCNVTDNIGVYDVWVNITLPDGGYNNDSMTQGPGNLWYYNNTHTLLGLYQYTIWTNDTNNNWNRSTGYSFMIQDATLPVISNVLEVPDTQESGGYVNITCDVTDNIGVYDVRVNITLPGGGYINDSMIYDLGNQWYYNSKYTPLGLYQYTIWANDTSDNWISSSGYNFTIQDTTLPVISNVLDDPDTQETGNWINITCNVTDNIGVSDVLVNLTLPGGGYINAFMIQGPNDLWFYNNTYSPLGLYQYIIWVNDTSDNRNTSSGHSFTIYDPNLPMISNVSAFPGTQESGDWVNITCDVTDNIGVSDVWVNITMPGGGYLNDSMILGSGDQWYYNNTHTPLGLYQYIIWAKDTSDNWNTSSGHMFTIQDTDLPEITNPTSTPEIQECGGSVNITVDVTDNLGVGKVLVNITFPEGSFVNITLTKGSGDEWYFDAAYLEVGAYSYTIWANDTSGNWNRSTGNTFAIVDTVAPVIQDLHGTPDPQSAGNNVNITCNTMDISGVYRVWVNITVPGGGTMNISMTQGAGDLWYHDTVYFDLGIYDYVVWTNDSFGNWNGSGGFSFTIEPGPVYNIILISGDGQSGVVGTKLADPLVIEVQDPFGNAVANAMVWFNVTVGGGSLDISSPVLSDSSGRAHADLTLGTAFGANEVTVEMASGGISQVLFNATGEPDVPYNIMVVSGNNAQAGFIGTELSHAFVVQVFDRFGNYVPNVEVWFNVSAGGGSLDTTNPVFSDDLGRAQTNLTLGATAGTNTVTTEISGGGTKQVTFTAFGLSNEPVINTLVSNVELLEDDPPFTLDLSAHAMDDVDPSQDLMWFVTDSDNSLYTVSGQGTDTLVITTKPNEFGNDMVTLWVMDSDGLQDSQSLWINITPVNDKPFFFPEPPDLTITGDVPYTFDYGPYIHDVDNEISELAIITSVSEATSSAEHKVIYTYPSSMIGQQVFVILILGDGLDDASEVIQVNITDDNVPVVIGDIPDVTMYEGETRLFVFDLDDYFDDPDGDAIYFSYGYSHINIKINENHSVDFIAESNWFGTETVTFRASDPDHAIAEDTITVMVIPRNDPPWISGVPDLVVRYNSTYQFDVTPYISDVDNTSSELGLSFLEFSGGDWVESEHIRISAGNNLKMVVNYSEVHLGAVIRVMIEVSDGMASANDIINITVSEDWPPELVREIPDAVFYEDEQVSNHINVHDHFTDPDGDTLFYTYGQVHVRIIIHPDGSVDLYADPNWFGTENITLRAADPHGALSEDIIMVTVLPVNDVPMLMQVPDQVGVVGETWIMDLGQYLSDVDNNITELEIMCDSSYIIVAGTVLIFQYPADMKEDMVEVTVRDPGNTSAATVFNITLAKAGIAGEGGVDIVQYLLTIILIIVILAAILILYAYQRGRYEVEELFLVIAESGNLISHSYQGEKELEDRDIMASMFTAVQDFISDSFDPEDHSKVPLKIMEIGDKKVMIERGEYTYLAAVFRGGIWRMASKIKATVANLEVEYGDKLKDWTGALEDLEGIDKHLDNLME